MRTSSSKQKNCELVQNRTTVLVPKRSGAACFALDHVQLNLSNNGHLIQAWFSLKLLPTCLVILLIRDLPECHFINVVLMAKVLNLAAKSTQHWLSIAQLLAWGRLFSFFIIIFFWNLYVSVNTFTKVERSLSDISTTPVLPKFFSDGSYLAPYLTKNEVFPLPCVAMFNNIILRKPYFFKF